MHMTRITQWKGLRHLKKWIWRLLRKLMRLFRDSQPHSRRMQAVQMRRWWRKQWRKQWVYLLPMWAHTLCQSWMHDIPSFYSVEQCYESHCYRSCQYERRLGSLLTAWLDIRHSHHRHHDIEVGHCFRTVPLHVPRSLQLLIIPKALASKSNSTGWQQFSQRHAWQFDWHYWGLSSRNAPYSRFLAISSFDLSFGYVWA